jgi:hypothetical protein
MSFIVHCFIGISAGKSRFFSKKQAFFFMAWKTAAKGKREEEVSYAGLPLQALRRYSSM